MRILELDDNIIYIDDSSFTCELEDGRKVYLGLVCEAIDLQELSDEYDDDPYPVMLITQVIVAPDSLDEEFLKRANDEGLEFNNDGIKVYLTYAYSGGVPVNLEGIKGSVTSNVDSEVRTSSHPIYGEIKTRYFRSVKDALQYAKDVYTHNCRALFGLIGLYLDRRLNLMGTTGWDIIQLQALNKDY